MNELEDQHVFLKPWFKLGSIFTDTLQMRQQGNLADHLTHTLSRVRYQALKPETASGAEGHRSSIPFTIIEDDYIGGKRVGSLAGRRPSIREISNEVWIRNSSFLIVRSVWIWHIRSESKKKAIVKAVWNDNIMTRKRSSQLIRCAWLTIVFYLKGRFPSHVCYSLSFDKLLNANRNK